MVTFRAESQIQHCRLLFLPRWGPGGKAICISLLEHRSKCSSCGTGKCHGGIPKYSGVNTGKHVLTYMHLTHTYTYPKASEVSTDFPNENRMSNGNVTCFILSKKENIERKMKGLILSLFGILIFYSLYSFLFSKSHYYLLNFIMGLRQSCPLGIYSNSCWMLRTEFF